MGGWMLSGIRRGPGPLIGTVVASAVAAILTVAAISTAAADTQASAGRLASASVVVAGSTNLSVTLGSGQNANPESLPLPAYRGVPASLAQRLARVPGAVSAVGESGFPNGTVRPGDVDLVAVTAQPGVPADVLAGRIRAALHGGQGYTIATGAARGDVANLNAAVERSNGQSLAGAIIVPIVLISLFVLASTTALAVNLRRRRFALLRAVGATRGQVRRAILAELAVCGAVGGALGWLPGTALGALGVRALAAHQMLPAGSSAWLSPWLIAIACGASALVAWLSGQVAARRGGRTAPAQALRETAAERKWPNPVRVVLGILAAGGSGTLAAFTLDQKSAAGQLGLAFPLLLACMLAIALLGPLLVAFTAWLARPAVAVGGAPARLALAAVAAQPRRAASAVIPVAMAVAMVGTIYFANTSIQHVTAGQASTTVTADNVLSGADLTAATLRQVRALPGVTAAAGVMPLSAAVTDPDLDQAYGEAVTGGPLGRLLDLGVTSGSAAAPRPGQIAVSALEAGSTALNVRTGSKITVYLPDGTPYHATVSAIYSRSLASGDLLLPASVAAAHTGSPAGYSQILVDGGTHAELARFTAGHPGLRLTSRSVANEQSAQAAAQNSFANNLILGVLGALSAVALVNTVVVTTVERRRVLRLLGRVGATRGQVAAMFGWQALFVAGTGLVAGVAAGAVTLLTVTRAVTGSWTPFIPLDAGIGLVAVVVALTLGAVMIPFGVMSSREPTLASG
jgi:putative ABC transport system permease protein